MARRTVAEAKKLEQRITIGATCVHGFAFLTWVISIASEYWYSVYSDDNGIYIEKTGNFFVMSHAGIWKVCRYFIADKQKTFVQYKCAYYNLFPANKDHNSILLDYQRTIAAFSIISLMIMLMGFAFSIYTFFQTRYMYKRVAAASHLVAAGCALVVIEVSSTMINYAADSIPYRHPPGSTWQYGFSFVLAWITFISELAAAIAFAICSRKRKKDKAPDERFAIEEEPTIIGR